MKLKITKLKAFVFAFWIIFFIAVYLNSIDRQPVELSFDLQVRASQTTENQGRFYFDTGYGFQDESSVTVAYETLQNSGMKSYRVLLPEKIQDIEKVRFMPLTGIGEVVVKNLRLSKRGKSTALVYQGPAKGMTGAQGIQEIITMGKQYYVITSGTQPYFELEGAFSYPFFSELVIVLKGHDLLQILMVIVFMLFLAVVLTVYSTNLKKGERPRIP